MGWENTCDTCGATYDQHSSPHACKAADVSDRVNDRIDDLEEQIGALTKNHAKVREIVCKVRDTIVPPRIISAEIFEQDVRDHIIEQLCEAILLLVQE